MSYLFSAHSLALAPANPPTLHTSAGYSNLGFYKSVDDGANWIPISLGPPQTSVGNTYDIGYGIAVDPAGNAYATSQFASSNFPATPGAFQSSLNNVFTAKINTSERSLGRNFWYA